MEYNLYPFGQNEPIVTFDMTPKADKPLSAMCDEARPIPNQSPIPQWEHPAPNVWSFALDDTTSAAIVKRDVWWQYEYGNLATIILCGQAVSKQEAFMKVHMAHAVNMCGENSGVIV